jgi:hypothetical protein
VKRVALNALAWRWLRSPRRRRVDPAAWGQAAPPSNQSDRGQRPQLHPSLVRKEGIAWSHVAGLAEAGLKVRASILRSKNPRPVPAAQRGGTGKRVAANALARSQRRRHSIQRLEGKPLHLNPRGQRPRLPLRSRRTCGQTAVPAPQAFGPHPRRWRGT